MPENLEFLNRLDGFFFSAPLITFDPVIGYHFRTTERARGILLKNGELIFDNEIRINNWHQHCSYDYSPQKSSPDIFRIVILGDSLTAGICMPRTWPEILQDLLRSHPENGRKIEVYGFPVDGGGILNWYEMFMRKILPTFEFDALILGDTGNDGSNRFIVAHSTDNEVYIGTEEYDMRPRSQDDFERVFKGMRKYHDIVSESVIDELVKRARQRAPLPPVKPSEYLNVDEAALLFDHTAQADQALTDWYGERRLGMLREIVGECRQRKAPVIYYSMPHRPDLLLLKKRRKKLVQQARAEAIARQLGIDYFDGYSAFINTTPRDIVNLCWLKHDGHWAMPGATLFAFKLAAWITHKGLIAKSIATKKPRGRQH